MNLAREKGYRGKRGGIPTAWGITRILTNPIYCGYNSLHGKIYRGNYPAIISPEIFNMVQMLLMHQGNNAGRPRKITLNQLPLD